MSNLTDFQKKIIKVVGAFAILAAIFSVGISLGRGSSGSSIAVSMMLLIAGIMLIFITQISEKK